MATKQIKMCDVTGKTVNVETYCISITRIPDDSEDGAQTSSTQVDLSPSALSRCVSMVQRGIQSAQITKDLNKQRNAKGEKFDPRETEFGDLFAECSDDDIADEDEDGDDND